MTTWAQLNGTYLTLSARTTCRACFVAGIRDGRQYVVSTDELRAFALRTGRAMAFTVEGRRLLVRRAAAHYAEKHPDVKFPRGRRR